MNKLGAKFGAIAMSAVMAFTFAPGAVITTLAAGSDSTTATEKAVPVYGLYNQSSGEHYFTVDATEVASLHRVGWKEGDVKWYAPTSGDPVYCLYNPNVFDAYGNGLGDHHYTSSKTERDNLLRAGWKQGDIAFYSATKDDLKRDTVYCLYNPNAYAMHMSGAHHLTLNQTEYARVAAAGWSAEGAKFYGYAEMPEPEKEPFTVIIDNQSPKPGDKLTATVSGGAAVEYEWTINNVVYATSESIIVPTTTKGGTEITVTAIAEDWEDASDTVYVVEDLTLIKKHAVIVDSTFDQSETRKLEELTVAYGTNNNVVYTEFANDILENSLGGPNGDMTDWAPGTYVVIEENKADGKLKKVTTAAGKKVTDFRYSNEDKFEIDKNYKLITAVDKAAPTTIVTLSADGTRVNTISWSEYCDFDMKKVGSVYVWECAPGYVDVMVVNLGESTKPITDLEVTITSDCGDIIEDGSTFKASTRSSTLTAKVIGLPDGFDWRGVRFQWYYKEDSTAAGKEVTGKELGVGKSHELNIGEVTNSKTPHAAGTTYYVEFTDINGNTYTSDEVILEEPKITYVGNSWNSNKCTTSEVTNETYEYETNIITLTSGDILLDQFGVRIHEEKYLYDALPVYSDMKRTAPVAGLTIKVTNESGELNATATREALAATGLPEDNKVYFEIFGCLYVWTVKSAVTENREEVESVARSLAYSAGTLSDDGGIKNKLTLKQKDNFKNYDDTLTLTWSFHSNFIYSAWTVTSDPGNPTAITAITAHRSDEYEAGVLTCKIESTKPGTIPKTVTYHLLSTGDGHTISGSDRGVIDYKDY